MKIIFVVDDNNSNLLTAKETLSEQYDVFTFSSASFMFELLDNAIPDLILLDIMMPDISGFEVLKRLKSDTRYSEIPVIFLTGKNDPSTEALGFEMGVIDYISKPFTGPVLLNRIKTHLDIEDIIKNRTKMLQQRTEKLLKLQNGMVSVLANMVENRDTQTGRHIERTTAYVKLMLSAMLERGIYADEINNWNLDVVASSSSLHDIGETFVTDEKNLLILEVAIWSARLHDIGKIVVSDLILNKPESLNADEIEIMKSHVIEGEKIIESIILESGDESFLQNAKLFAGSHHEKWDGTGYPRGLKGEDIPLQGRIMAIADVYDALVSNRPYKKAFTHEKALEIIHENKGSHFDPKIADVFLEIHESFAKYSSV